MPTIEIDITFFLVETILVFVLTPISFFIVIRHAYKNPEFWLRLRKKGYVYGLIRNLLGRFVQVVVPLDRIGSDGEFKMFNRTYYWINKDPKDGTPVVMAWKKSVAAIYDWNDPYPQKFVPGNSLTSMTDPGMLDSLGEAKDFKMMLNADALTRLMRLGMVVSVIAAMISIGAVIGLVLNAQSTAEGFAKLYHVLNSTRTGP
jgi:hypothetical protein